MKFGEVLVSMGYITGDQLDKTIQEQLQSRNNSEYVETIGNILLRKGYLNDDQHTKALLEYFKYLVNANDEPVYVRETAKVAMKALDSNSSGKLSEEAKLTLVKKIHEFEEKIAYDEKSIQALSGLEQKKVIVDTIEKEKKEIQTLLAKIDTLKKDLEKLS